VLWGIVACLFAGLRSASQFFILRFALGLAESGAYPCALLCYPAFLDLTI
jgi:hypothetical protein